MSTTLPLERHRIGIGGLPAALRDAVQQPHSITLLSSKWSSSEVIEQFDSAGLQVIPSREGLVSIVRQGDDTSDYSRQTTVFDYHVDGLAGSALPRFVVLGCVDSGRGDTPTTLVDTRLICRQLAAVAPVELLNRLELVYVDHAGREHFHPFLAKHSVTNEGVLRIGTAAFLRPLRGLGSSPLMPTLRIICGIAQAVFQELDGAAVVRHYWSAGDILIFDNETYAHAREADTPDSERVLTRVWIGQP
jgi:alpha-ketoglutarate-dependent taurine dioxygenase